MDEVTWLEIVHRRDGVVERRRLDARPLVIGRGYGADLIVDDPQVCSAHVRVARDETGALTVEDLASVNGTWSKEGERVGRSALRSGATLRIGQTELRFFGPESPVAPTETASAGVRRRLAEPRAAALLAAAAMVLATVEQFAGEYKRITAPKMVGEALGIVLVLLGYAALWAFVSRVVVRRFNFRAHLSIASLGLLGVFGAGAVTSYLEFGLPDRAPVQLAGSGVGLAVLGAVLAGHLAYASALSRRARAAVLGTLAALVLALAGVGKLGDEDFSSMPRFSAVLKPVGVGVVPTTNADDFVGEAAELRDAVDELAKKRPAGH